MKKLLLGASIIFAAVFSTKAQTTILYQNYNGLSSQPVGWTQNVTASNVPDNNGWEVGNSFPVISGGLYDYIPAHGYYTFVDDADYNYPADLNNFDTLYLPSINCSAYSHVFISFDALLWLYSGSEKASLAVSTNGGATWTSAVNIANLGSIGGNAWSDSLVFDISSYAAGKPNVLLAFTYADECASSGYPTYCIAIANIDVFVPPAYDLSVVQSTTTYMLKPGNSVTFTGTIFNWGGDSITSMRLNYLVSGSSTPQSDVITSTVNRLAAYNFSHNIPWTPGSAGNYSVKFWCDELNVTNTDVNHSNDTLIAYFSVLDSIQTKMALFEEFTQASCDPCMEAAPDIEPALYDAQSYCNSFRYHPDWPGLDYMNEEIDNLFVEPRVIYYGVDGVPDGKIDGTTDWYPGNSASSTDAAIQTANAIGAPMKITISSCTYNPTTNKFDLQASIKSYAAIPEATIARIVLSIDTIKYDSNQSDEDPTVDFAPPTGSTSGGIPDTYYKYVKDFPQVAEEMMPSSVGPNGTPLASFSIGQTQSVNASWLRNHAWGAQASGENCKYDSLFPGEHITIFIQEDQAAANTARPTATGTYPTHGQSGAVTTYVYQSASAPVTIATGMEEIANGVYFELYPNPTNNNTNVAFKLAKEQNVSIEVYSMLGEKVYSANEGMLSSGQHIIMINGSALQSGIYFVRFITDNSTTTQKLVIQK